jgi:glyoxylase-like metal-dependent hydrolase (beta-lactamase superfamily II)
MELTNEVELLPNQGWDERILVCRNGEMVDVFLIVTVRYVVLVDTLINPATAAKAVAFAQPYLHDGRQLLVVNTHADFDHAWGNQLFAGPGAPYPAPILASRLCAERFHNGEVAQKLVEMQQTHPAIFAEVVPTPPTLTFDDKLIIDGGDLTIQLLPTPGHTEDHIALYLPEIRTLLAADAAEVPFPLANSAADLPVMRASIAQLAALNPAVALYCHAPVTIGPQLLHDNITYFDRIEAHCRQALARGLPSDFASADVIALVGLPFEQAAPDGEHWQGVSEYQRTEGHARQIRLMLAWLAALAASSKR